MSIIKAATSIFTITRFSSQSQCLKIPSFVQTTVPSHLTSQMTREGRKPYIQQARTDKWLTCFAWKMTETINNMSKWLATNFAPIDRLINPLMAAAVVWKWFDETSFYLTFEYLLSLHQRRISSLFKAAVVNQLRSPSCALLRSVLQSDDLKKKKKYHPIYILRPFQENFDSQDLECIWVWIHSAGFIHFSRKTAIIEPMLLLMFSQPSS